MGEFMDLHQQKIELIRKYYKNIKRFDVNTFYVGNEIPEKTIVNAMSKFKKIIARENIIGFLDTSVSQNGKDGFLFTDDEFYFLANSQSLNLLKLTCPKSIKYNELVDIYISGESKLDNEKYIDFELNNGEKYRLTNSALYKTPLKNLLLELQDIDKLVNKSRKLNLPSMKMNRNEDFGFNKQTSSGENENPLYEISNHENCIDEESDIEENLNEISENESFENETINKKAFEEECTNKTIDVNEEKTNKRKEVAKNVSIEILGAVSGMNYNERDRLKDTGDVYDVLSSTASAMEKKLKKVIAEQERRKKRLERGKKN